jgi:uncharacterized membrane protein
MGILITGILVFLGVHSVRMLAPGWRDARIAAMGEGPWKGTYSLVSLAGLALLVWGYSAARPVAADIWFPPSWMAHLSILLMLFALISLAVAQFPSGRLKPILKHPTLLAVKIWAVAHLLVNGDLASILLFGSFLAWAVWNRIAVKRRGGALPVAGPVTYDIGAVVTGVVLWGLFIWQLHQWIAGVPLSFTK